ncbi:MAG TPA: winged helix-turn-helix domain-containing protein [Burkholderiaceae bacterium]
MTTSNLYQPMNMIPLHAAAPNDANALLARAAAPARDRRSHARRRGDFLFGRREVSAARREVLVDGKPRTLQPRPFDVLVYLIEHRERVVSTDELLDHIWKDEFVQPGSLAAAVMRIRKALLDVGADAGAIIRTHQGIGYRFVAELDGDDPAGTAEHDA